MYSILIVDDSAAERDCVEFLIKKHRLPLMIRTACNGREALELLKKEPCDILFTDVKMPFMDGLALSRASLGYSLGQKIIIFSGYNEFEYAKTAMGLGVRDYLLKPLDPREFRQVMGKVTAEIAEGRQKLAQQERRESLMHRHLLLRLLSNVPADSLAGEGDGAVSLDFLSDYCRMALMESRGDFFSGRGLRFEAYLRENLSPLPLDYLNISPNQSAVFLRKGEGAMPRQALCDAMGALARRVEAELGEVLFIAVGGKVTPSTIGSCYRELEELLEIRFFFPGIRVFYAGMAVSKGASHENPISLELIQADLALRDYDGMRGHLRYLFSELRSAPGYSELYVKFFFSGVIRDIMALLPERCVHSLESAIDHIYRSDSIALLEGLVMDAVTLLETHVPVLTTQAGRTEAVRQYIQRHYREDLSLDVLAREVYVHPDYLCRIFKQETGTTLNKFIKACRMEKARELLEGSRMKIRDVCEAVGYQNVSYFCQSFREYFGISPERLRQGEKDAAR